MNYKFVQNKEELQKFIDKLPELEDHMRYYIALQARKKYCKDILRADSIQVKKLVVKKKDIIKSIRQLECELGLYTTREGKGIPQDAFVLLFNVNPRDLKKASYATIHELLRLMQNGQYGNPKSIAYTGIHKAKGRTDFVHFDIDDQKSDQIYPLIESIIPPEAFFFIETRGGCHLLISPDKIPAELSKTWYKSITSHFKADVTGDFATPLPGCVQSDFIPYIYEPK